MQLLFKRGVSGWLNLLVRLSLFLFLATSHGAYAQVYAELSVEGRGFLEPQALPPQFAAGDVTADMTGAADGVMQPVADPPRQSLSVDALLEWRAQLGEFDWIMKPYARIDSADSQRNLFDLREAMLSYYQADYAVQVGVGKVFWGQSESVHLVDIINQTDFVASVDGEEKLGQPMLAASYYAEWGTLTGYVLPVFRERTFAGVDGRLRGPVAIADAAAYEHPDEQSHVDMALRWQHFIGALDIGLAHFSGTSRLPQLRPTGQVEAGLPQVQPFYTNIEQTSVDALYVSGDALWKFEAIRRVELDAVEAAAVGGIEYTAVNALDSGYDLGYLAEYQYDTRDTNPLIVGQNDLMLGARVNFNDVDGSELLFAITQDLSDSGSRIAMVEYAQRIGSNVKVFVEAYVMTANQPDDPMFFFAREDHVKVRATYYF